LKDLLYHSESQPNWVNEAKRLVNFAKLDSMGKIISVFWQAQMESAFHLLFFGAFHCHFTRFL